MTKIADGPSVGVSPRPTWTELETAVREQGRRLLEPLLEAEVTELLGRMKGERRTATAAPAGYRHGYGKPRRLALLGGTGKVRRPRRREASARCESSALREPRAARAARCESRALREPQAPVLHAAQRGAGELGSELLELDRHGLAQGDCALARRHLWSAGAPLSQSSIARLAVQWRKAYERWHQRARRAGPGVYAWGVRLGCTPGRLASM